MSSLFLSKKLFGRRSAKFAMLACLSAQMAVWPVVSYGEIGKEPNTLQANQVAIRVTGRVVDEKGVPMPGVGVKVKGSPISTVTNQDGKFTIEVPDEKVVLVFSFIGYLTKDRTVGTDRNIEVTLLENVSQLNEVVAVGYGTVARRDLTGSVGSVSMEDLQKAPVRSFDEALAGRVAGVQVSSDTGQPGSAINIIIRGNNSLTQDNSPLYIIDGFPLENPNNNIINPEEIESIEVLKDASSTAIYGARGANGVIIITTKRGKVGAPKINYNGSYGIQQVIREMELFSPYEFVRYQLERDATNSQQSYLSDGRTLEDYRNVTGVNWQDQLFNTRPMHNHNLSISGGTDQTRYFVSGSYVDQKGIITNSGYSRYQGRFNLDQYINKNFKVGINVNYSNLQRNGTVPSDGTMSETGLMFSVWGYRPVTGKSIVDLEDDPIDNDLDLVNDSRFNPLFSAENELRRNTTNSLRADGYAEYNILKNLKLRVTGGLDRNSTKNEVFNNSLTRSGSPFTQSGKSNGVNGSVTLSERSTYVNENTLTYNKTFNKNHRFTALAGATFQGSNIMVNGAAAEKLPNENLGLAGLDEGIPVSIRASESEYTLASFLGRVNYNYKSKYLLTASFRTDGSSKFASGNKWGYFPSAGVAWTISEEKFLKNVSWLSNAKFRLSHGITGNNRVSDFAYLSVISLPADIGYSFGNGQVNAAIPSSLGNRNLKWETTRQTDLGLDLGFFKQRLSVEVDLYRKNTYDLLLQARLPNSLGFNSSIKNIGKVQNEGLEFTVNSVNLSRSSKLSWTTNFNIAFNRNKVLELSENQTSFATFMNWDGNYRNLPLYIAQLNQPMAMYYGYIWEGNYQYTDFDQSGTAYTLKNNVATNGNDRATIRPGDIKYRDVNGDGVVDANDRVVIGNPNPDFIGGLSNNFAYGGFDLNVFLQFSVGSEIYNANRLVFEGMGRPQQNMFATYANRWTPENQNNEYYRTNGWGPYAYSSRVIEDGSFLRLKTVQLGYSLPAKMLSKYKIKALRVYAAAQNLYTWTKYSGFDPEVSSMYSALTPSFDYSVYPRARTITFGLNLNL